MLITIEGIDGAGKTTLAAALADRLGATLLRDPGGPELSERIRVLVKDPELTVGPRAEALLYAAARAQLVESELRPRLDRGETVVLDRFTDSSLAYQGAGRGLDGIAAINAFGTGGLTPDRTLLLRIDPAEGRRRRGGVHDRLEREDDAFFARIGAAFDALAAAEPARFAVLDGALAPDQVLRAALSALART